MGSGWGRYSLISNNFKGVVVYFHELKEEESIANKQENLLHKSATKPQLA